MKRKKVLHRMKELNERYRTLLNLMISGCCKMCHVSAPERLCVVRDMRDFNRWWGGKKLTQLAHPITSLLG